MTQIVLLRAVNLPSHKKIGMGDLRAFFEALGFEAQTLLQSGNAVLRGGKGTGTALEAKLEKAAAAELKLETDFFVRTAKVWDAVIKGNPFPREAKNDPGHLVVMPLKKKPAAAGLKALRAAIKGREQVEAGGKHLYITFPDGIGRSKLTTRMIEDALGTTGTGRNWNTVLKLAAAAKD